MSEMDFSQQLAEYSGGISERFRRYLPVVVDVETSGLNCATDALLEIAAIPIIMDSDGLLVQEGCYSAAIAPFEGANINESSMKFNGIKLDDPERNAETEKDALNRIFAEIRRVMKEQDCIRAVLVAHNAHFDLGFVNAAAERSIKKRNPFHPFSCFDTATLAGLAYGETVLAKACETAGIAFNQQEAHSAAYDTERTAELFCTIVNRWKALGGWQPSYELDE